ncbi:MAG: GNAT family N-acetyltransferase [Chitinophagaceae bacterium]
MNFSIQPSLRNEKAALVPLREEDFADLYALAADPKVWEQHPNNDRWKEDVFRLFFEGAMKSKGAFRVIDVSSGKAAGCTRFYDYQESDNSIFIGYTFYATRYWGTGINLSVKKLMLDYIFQYVDKVYFHIGASNLRSQIAIGRLGAVKVGEEAVAYYGTGPRQNFRYQIRKEDWHTA